MVLGTPKYMAPEQAKGESVDHRCDLFSLGSVLYHLASGKAPFEGGNLTGTLIAVSQADCTPIDEVCPDLHPELVKLIGRLLSKDREDRPQSAAQVAETMVALEETLDKEAVKRAAEEVERLKRQNVAETMALDRSPVAEPEPTAVAGLPTEPLGATAGLDTAGRPTVESGAGSGDPRPAPVAQQAPSPHRGEGWDEGASRMPIYSGGFVAIALAVFGWLYFSGVIFKVENKDGTLIVKVTGDDFATSVQGQVVTIRNTETDETYKIDLNSPQETKALKPGEYKFEMTTDSGLKIKTDHFTIQGGADHVVEVSWEPKQQVAANTSSQRKQVNPDPLAGAASLYADSTPNNYALSFDGKSSYVETPVNCDVSHPITIEAVVRRRTDGFVYIVDMFPCSLVLKESALQVIVYDGWGDKRQAYTIYAESKLGPDARHHVAGIYDGTTLRLFVNGVQVQQIVAVHEDFEGLRRAFDPSTTKISIQQNTHAIPLQIGTNWTKSHFFQGIIDEVRISNVARYTEDFTPAKRFEPDEHTVALYHFDEGTGDVLIDSSGNEHHGKIVGAKWVRVDDELRVIAPEPEENWALEFDGEKSAVESPVRYDGTHPLTVEATVYLASVGTHHTHSTLWNAYPVLFYVQDFSEYSKQENDYRLTCSLYNNEGAFVVRSDERLRVKDTLHLATVFESHEVRLFVNGKPLKGNTYFQDKKGTELRLLDPDETIELADDFPITTGYIGVDYSGSGVFHGIIDEVRISNVARYTEDFTPAKRFEPDEHTVALYHFDEGAGDILIDSSGNEHHGKIVGAKWVRVDGLDLASRQGVAEVNLAYTDTSDSDLHALGSLQTLTSLNLAQTQVTGVGLSSLAGLKELKQLNLGNTPVTFAGLQTLKQLPQLDSLDLRNTNLNSDEFRVLSHCTNLSSLTLLQTRVDDPALLHLVELENLTVLDLRLTSVTQAGVDQLRKALPKCKIKWDSEQ